MRPDDLLLLDAELEQDLRATVRDLLADRCPPEPVIALYDGDRSLVPPLWHTLAAELGLAGLLVPEDLGGAGASAREAAVVMEELGQYAAPVPFLTSSVIATTALLSATTDAGRDLLAALAAGERTAALVVPWTTTIDAPPPTGDTVTSVAGALEADTLLVPVETDGGLELRALATADATVEPVVSLDMTRQLADVTLRGGDQGDTAVPASAGADSVRRALLAGTALLASEQVGVAQWCLWETIGYLKERRQFGRAVGGFQALKHRLADLYTSVEGAGAAARYAAAAIADGQPEAEVEIAARVAQAWCSETAVRAAEEAIQLHGGIGMTWEHPAHLYLKRAKADQLALGLPGHHRARLGDLVGLTV